MYYLFDNFSSFDLLHSSVPGETLFFTPISQGFLLDQILSGLHPISVYYFPFIYIFILITVLSILFCLAYNANEFTTFIFFCMVILTAGYSMFFTSSLLVFFSLFFLYSFSFLFFFFASQTLFLISAVTYFNLFCSIWILFIIIS